jgi:hypothetical protein
MSRHDYGQYGYAAPSSGPDNSVTPQGVSARTVMPTVGEMGGPAPAPWIRFPFFPTAPFYSTNPNVGYQVRYYSAGVLSTDGDIPAGGVPNGGEVIRTIQFDIPCRIIAVNASFAWTGTPVAANALNLGTDPLDLFLFRMEYTTGDRLQTQARLASTVCGSGADPAEIGGTGYTVDQGGSMVLGITPLPSIADGIQTAWRIDVTLHCLEMRGSSNFVGGQGGR